MAEGLQVCVLTFQVTATTGVSTQTISGVSDQDGHNFAGQQFLFFGMATALNTIESAGGVEFVSGYHIGWGTDHLATRQSGLSTDEVKSFNAKIVSGSAADATSGSVISNFSTILFGGTTTVTGTVSAVASGSFDVHYTVNDGSQPRFIAVILGGSDFTVSAGFGGGSGANPIIATTNTPSAVLFDNSGSGTGGTATSAGGFPFAYGWGVRQPNLSLGTGAMSTHVINQAGNIRYQDDGFCYARVGLSGSTPVLAESWGLLDLSANQFQLSGPGPFGAEWISIGGTNIAAACGTASMPGSPGLQTVTAGLKPRVVLVLSTGTTTTTSSSSVDTALANVSIGAFDKSGRQLAYWSGENTNGNGVNINGARILRNDAVLLFGTPAAAGTTMSSRANFSATSDSGASFTLNWTAVDGTARDYLWMALGFTGSTPPPPPPTARVMRRVRRFPLPYEKNLWQFLARLEILIQAGVGLSTGQGSNPILMCRISRDGGHTFGNELQMGLGAMGQYDFRAYVNRLGRGRNFVVEVVVTDPVFVGLLGAVADLTTGTS